MSDTGRPTRYDPSFCRIAEKMCELGAVDQEIADALDVSVRTLYRWRAEHDQFCQALKAGKTPADDRVEASLYHRAIGYTHPDIDIRVVSGEIVETPITKHYPPDTRAALAWLYNRRSDQWHPQPKGDTAEALDKVIKVVRASRSD